MVSPTNNLVGPLLTDLYQLTMTYAHWKTGKQDEPAIFELFFRKNPFRGEFTVFCGLDECVKYLSSFRFSPEEIDYLKSSTPLKGCEEDFFDYLRNLDTSKLVVRAMREGTLAFPRVPLIIIEAPLGLGQLLETTLLNLVNYPSLLATNAARMVLRAHPAPCAEFGLRRAQGPDGACSASKYSYVGGFVATSNVQAGKTFGIPVVGTHAHAYVQAFSSLEEVQDLTIYNKKTGAREAFLPYVLKHRKMESTNDGELAAFTAYACSFPDSCLCLIDTYDTIKSGLPNFTYVAKALDDLGYKPKGIRLDSGDLAQLSLECANTFRNIQESEKRQSFGSLSIVVSNDINERVLDELTRREHGITTYGIGTNLVTCQAQPALGCVYKLVEWKGKPRIKISQDMPKVTIPGRKQIYRIYGSRGTPLLDLMVLADDDTAPQVGTMITCCNPFEPTDRVNVVPSKVDNLHSIAFSEGKDSTDGIHGPSSLSTARTFVQDQLGVFSEEITRYNDPQPYRVMVSENVYRFFHELWEREVPLPLLS